MISTVFVSRTFGIHRIPLFTTPELLIISRSYERTRVPIRFHIQVTATGQDEFIPTRHSLLTRLKDWDDQEGWREFFDTYWKFLYAVAVKAGLSDADAQDVVQDTVVAVARGLREGRFRATAGGSFKAWLKLIVQRRVVDLLRRRRSRPDHDAPNLHDTDQAAEFEAIQDPAAEAVAEIWDEEWARNLADAAAPTFAVGAGCESCRG
jgi:RNA polymerase sigma factor (sigma-70 family)